MKKKEEEEKKKNEKKKTPEEWDDNDRWGEENKEVIDDFQVSELVEVPKQKKEASATEQPTK